MIDRNFTATAQLITSAPDQATADANVKAALAAIQPVLDTLPGISVALSAEMEAGQIVFQEA